VTGVPVKRTAYIALLIGLAAIIALVARQGARDVFAVLTLGGWSLGILLPLHLLPLIPDAAAWRVLIHERRRLPWLCSIAWIRQAVNRLLPLASIGGEIVGVRLLMQGGVPAADAAASVVVEVFATLVGQYIFVLLGLFFVVQRSGATPLARGILAGLAAVLPLILVLLFILRRGSIFSRLHKVALKLIGRESDFRTLEASSRIDAAILRLLKDPLRLGASTALQVAGMILGCLEIWAVFNQLGGHISLQQALIAEVLNQTAKHVMFFVPGALGVQELSLLAIAPFLGVHPDVAIGASLVKRAVDVIIGLPALIFWQWTEGQRVMSTKP
jgi:putative membrane protein